MSNYEGFFANLGFPDFQVHDARDHFDFTQPGRRVLVIGPMGAGKTEFSARVWRDSLVALNKSSAVARLTKTGVSDRRRVFFVRSQLDGGRFSEYPEDALAYRGGYERLGGSIARVRDSFDLERVIDANPHVGTWIIDETSFYDERIAYVIARESDRRGLVFVLPTLVLNFRKEIFNATARLLLECATDIRPLTAYCEHPDCLVDSVYTYRYYVVEQTECPALYFDPLVVVGGDRVKAGPVEPNYATRCADHHILPGKEYTYLTLKPLGVEAAHGNWEPLLGELRALRDDVQNSALAAAIDEHARDDDEFAPVRRAALLVPNIAEKALIYLFAEQNLIAAADVRRVSGELSLDDAYIERRCADQGRSLGAIRDPATLTTRDGAYTVSNP